ncbi:MAG: Trp biosynthesis-associated membrane protein [Antricoccus sp.]
MNRTYAGALAALAVSGGLSLFAASQIWLVATQSRSAPLPSIVKSSTGGALQPAMTALGIVLILAILAVGATKRIGRRIVGAMVAICGIAILALSFPFLGGPPAWAVDQVKTGGDAAQGVVTAAGYAPWISALCGVLALAAGLLIALRGPQWSAMGKRFERPSTTTDQQEFRDSRDAWNALDQGIDPT